MISHKLLRKQVTSEIKKRRLIVFTLMFLSLLYLAITFTFGNSGLIRYLELKDKKSHLVQEIERELGDSALYKGKDALYNLA